MATIQAFLKRYPAATYFALTFLISWGGSLAAIGPRRLPGAPEEVMAVMPAAVLMLLAGPSVSGLLLTALAHGRRGLRDYLYRLLRWRAGARWYAVALLTAPLLMTAILLALSLLRPEFLPGILAVDDKAALLSFGIPVALSAGFFEELGWTGFAIPELRRRHSVLATGLIVGIVWAVWHLLFAYWLSGLVSGPLSLASYLLDPFLFLTLFRTLMVWVYDRTESLLLAMLMHMSLTGSARILGAPEIAGTRLMTFDLAWVVALGLVIVAVAAADRRLLSRPSFRERAA
jgi:hypothetical protein